MRIEGVIPAGISLTAQQWATDQIDRVQAILLSPSVPATVTYLYGGLKGLTVLLHCLTQTVTLVASTSAYGFDLTTNFVLTPGRGVLLYYDDITGSWRALTSHAGTVTSVATVQPAAGLTVTGGPITANGTLTFALADDLAAVEALATTGGVERTGVSSWATYTLTAAGKALLDDANASAQRATLGIHGVMLRMTRAHNSLR